MSDLTTTYVYKKGLSFTTSPFCTLYGQTVKVPANIRLSRFFRGRFRPFPCPVAVINDKHHRRDRPGDRVAEDDGVEARSEWYDEEEPGDTQQADTETGDKHRNHNIAGSAECTREQFDEDEQAVCRSNVV